MNKMSHNVLHVSAGPLHSATLCGNGGEGLLTSPLIRLLDLVARCGRWWQLQTLHNLPKIFSGHRYLQLELIEVEVVVTELVEHDVAIALIRSHFTT